jgi:rhamnulokinase
MKRAADREDPVSSISCDAWGLDYMLFDKAGDLIGPTFHYRDARTEQSVPKVLNRIPWEEIFAETGVQFMPINTLFQLAAESDKRLKKAARILPVGDGFNYLLSGTALCGQSSASTTQLYNPREETWANSLIAKLGFDRELFPKIVPCGTRLGALRPEIVKQTGLAHEDVDEIEVVASCSHDTAAAVAAVPATGRDWAYLSSGTWSLMGIESAVPIMTSVCRDLNFTNEIGHGGSVRLLKNIVGLWIVQECRRDWARKEQDYDYAMLGHLAASADPFVSLINPNDPRFLSPGDMPEKIRAFCKETGQRLPKKPGEFIRCVLESLALLYRRTLRQLETISGRKIERLHIVGGGAQNTVLNHFTANALQIPVIIGPIEATSVGNLLVQAIALGHVSSLEEARRIVRDSFPIKTIQPREAAVWEDGARRFESFFEDEN